MNRPPFRLLITVGIIIVAGIIALFIWKEVASFHKLTIKDNAIAATYYQVVDGENTNTSTIKADRVISVKNGQYCVAPTDSTYDMAPLCVTVKNKDATLSVNSPYSTDYLSTLLTDSLANQLTTIITNKYQTIIANYNVDRGQLFDRGEWYATTLTVKVAPQDRGDVYRTILKKTGDTWAIAAPPQIVLSKYDYPSIPFTVLSGANQLPGDS